MRKAIWIAVAATFAVGATWVAVNAIKGTNTSLAEVSAAWGAADSRDLIVAFGPCGMTWDATATETATAVTVKVVLDHPIRWGGSCTDEAGLETFTLDAPLGDRRVIDAATGNTVPVGGRDDDAPG